MCNYDVKFEQYVEKGYLKSEAGLTYLQEAINKDLASDVVINIVKFEDRDDKTVLFIESNYPVIPNIVMLVSKCFNRRKRWLKNK